MITLQEMAQELGLSVETRGDGRTDYYCPVHDNNTGDLSLYHGEYFACHGSGGKKAVSLLMHVKQWDDTSKAISWMKEHFPENFEEIDEETIDRKQKAKEVLNKARDLAYDTLHKQKEDLLDNIKDKRNFDSDIMNETKIGFLSHEDVDTLTSRYNKQALIDSGLFSESDEEVFCHLKGRIVFPYMRGDQTYFMIGRKLPDSESDAKYKKTRTTDYNQHILYQFSDGEKDDVVITEGVTDAISAWKAGLDVVSPVTVQFRQDDIDKVIERVKSYSNIYLVNDSDEAGQKGAEKTARQLVESGKRPNMVQLDVDDLDDHTTENGYDISGLLEDSSSFLDLKMEEVEEETVELEKPEARKKIFRMIKDWEESKQMALIRKWSSEYEVTKSELRQAKEETSGKTTEHTEDTEHTEEFSESNESSEENMFDLANQKEPVKKRLSGVVEDTFYIITWLYNSNRGRYFPVALTSSGEVIRVKNKLEERKKEISSEEEWESIPDKDKQAMDYDFMRLKGEEVQFKHKISEQPAEQIFKPTNQILELLQETEKIKEKEELFEEVKSFVKKYWSHYHEEWYDLLTAFIFHTYLIQPIGYTFYLYLHGEPDTGKTSLQLATSWLEYNGLSPNVGTPKASVRFAHSFQSSLNLEETEKEGDKAKSETIKLFNSGYRKGGSYPIADPDKIGIEEQIQSIYSFNPKKFSANSVRGWVDSFESRCTFLKTVRTDEDMADPAKIGTENREEAEKLRNQVAAYSLFNWKEITEGIEDYRSNLSVSGREADKLSLWCGIVGYFKGGKAAKELKNRIKEEEDISGVSDLNASVKKILVKLVKVFNDQEAEQIQVRFSDLAEYVNEELQRDENYQLSSQGVGSKLRDYDLIRDDSMKVTDSSGYTCLEIDRETFRDSMTRYNLTSFADDLVSIGKDEEHVSSETENNPENHSVSSVSSVSSVENGRFESDSDHYSTGEPKNPIGSDLWSYLQDSWTAKAFIVNSLKDEHDEVEIRDYIEDVDWIEIKREDSGDKLRKNIQKAQVASQ